MAGTVVLGMAIVAAIAAHFHVASVRTWRADGAKARRTRAQPRGEIEKGRYYALPDELLALRLMHLPPHPRLSCGT